MHPMLTHMNPVYSLKPYFFDNHFNINPTYAYVSKFYSENYL